MERNPPRTPATDLAFAFAFALLACACSLPAPAPETAAPAAQPGAQPAGADARAFAGTYSGTLPCADCPGIDETLALSADGGFVLTDTYRERPDSANVVRGSWSLEDGGKRIRLDPGSEDATDKFYEVDGDGLRMLDGEGRRIDSGLPYRLKRGA